jgi:Amidase/Glutathione S-transferase, C-terminal domain
MPVHRPTLEELLEASSELGLHLSKADAESFHGLMQAQLDAYDIVDKMAAPLPEVRYPRAAAVRPTSTDNPFGAWAVKANIRGASNGKLSGKRVAIKDNVCVAGVPMMNGASILEGYVPEIDATIVTRMLDQGAEILGKIGGGFGHFYAYAPTKIEYAIDRFAMEVKRQLDVLDRRLAETKYLAGHDYTIADIAVFPWYGGLAKGWSYGAAEFLSVQDYKHVQRWADTIFARPTVKRGRMVNRMSGDLSEQLRERHNATDFDTKTQDKLAQANASKSEVGAV